MFTILYMVGFVVVIGALLVFLIWAFVQEIKTEINGERKGVGVFIDGMASPTGGLVPVEDELEDDAENAIAVIHEWAIEHGYISIESYWTRFPDNPVFLMSIWEHPEGTILSHYFANKKSSGGVDTCDFVSILRINSLVSLTTSNSKDGNPMPARTGVMKQSFPTMGLDELYANHSQGLDYLKTATGFQQVQLEEPVSEFITQWVRDDANFVRTHFLWTLRIFIWYFRRKRFQGIPVWIRYPNITPADLPR